MKNGKRKAPATFYVHTPTVATASGILNVSGDNRRVRMRKTQTANISLSQPAPDQASTTSNQDTTSGTFALDESTGNFEGVVHQIEFSDQIRGVRVIAKQKAKRYENSDVPLKTFLEYRQAYLDENLCNEGRGDYQNAALCPDSNSAPPRIRCKDCYGEELVCEGCAVARHRKLPLHMVERWIEDGHFTASSLAQLGLVVGLGHLQGTLCPIGQERELIVIHTNGIHRVKTSFCRCNIGVKPWQQLMRTSWWPATPIDPHTVATFAVLRQFHYQNLQGNLTTYDFYRALEFLTDGRLLADLPDREYYFNIMVREWRNIKLLKRFGRGHDPSGVAGTQPAELIIPCRACPHPEKNLPEGWDKVLGLLAFLYWMFHAQDANFRLKSRFRNTSVQDVCLSPGWGCFVEQKEYLEHVSKYANQEEISTCAGFQALHLANLKKMRGLSATGVAGCVCSRHEMWRALGDLQKGERYCNMDYILATSLLSVLVISLVATYDIACQYFNNLWIRRNDLPPRLRPPIDKFKESTKAKIPKAHINAHKKDCHGIYSLNYTVSAGRVDGEGIERSWACLNKAAPSTREMTQSGRKEALDDFCNFTNYRKVLGLGDTLLLQMLEGLKEAADHQDEFLAFDAALRRERPETVEQWEQELQDFNSDLSKPCPYIVASETITVQDAKLKLIKEEEQLIREGKGTFSTQEGSATAFILLGLEIEELQESIKRDTSDATNTLRQTTRMERRIALWKKIQQYRKVQTAYMPGLARMLCAIEEQNGSPGWQQAENVPLYLPSNLDPATRATTCDPRVITIEEALREAQAYETLDALRRELRARVFANMFKIKNVTGQRASTKARDWQKTIDQKAIVYKHQYRRARAALLALRGPGAWSENVLRDLTDADVRAFNERAMTDEEARERQEARRVAGLVDEEVLAVPLDEGIQLGEGRRRISWIWYSMGTIGLRNSDEDLNEALKVEWARSHSRSRSWIEDVALVWEEMRRSVHYCLWFAQWWEQQAGRRTDVEPELAEGLSAFAKKQAVAERTLGQRWEAKFAPVRSRAEDFLKTTYLAAAVDLKNLPCRFSGDVEPMLVDAGPLQGSSAELLEDDFIQLALEDPLHDLDIDEYD